MAKSKPESKKDRAAIRAKENAGNATNLFASLLLRASFSPALTSDERTALETLLDGSPSGSGASTPSPS